MIRRGMWLLLSLAVVGFARPARPGSVMLAAVAGARAAPREWRLRLSLQRHLQGGAADDHDADAGHERRGRSSVVDTRWNSGRGITPATKMCPRPAPSNTPTRDGEPNANAADHGDGLPDRAADADLHRVPRSARDGHSAIYLLRNGAADAHREGARDRIQARAEDARLARSIARCRRRRPSNIPTPS